MVDGLRFGALEGPSNVPLFADISSDFLSAAIDTDRYSMIYAYAQNNFGPLGVTVALVKRSSLERVATGIP